MIIVKTKKTTLKSPLAAAGTTVQLTDFVDSKGNALALADFGTWGVIVVKQGTTVEIIKFDGVTQNSDGSATLNVATNGRNIDPTSPFTGYSTGSDFQGTAEVIVTNDPLTMSRLANLDVAGTFNAVMTFAAIPQITGGDPLNDEDIPNRAWVLSQVNGGAVSVNRIVVSGVAGEALAAGDLIYFDETDNEWKKCDANTASTLQNVGLGIAQGAGSDGGTITNGVLLMGRDANQTGMTQGDLMYASDTAGEMTNAAGTVERVIGIARSATELDFNPFFYYLLTKDLKDALAGSGEFGTPASANKFLTQDYIFNNATAGGTLQSQSTTTNAIEFGEADATGRKNKITQKFTATKPRARGVKLHKKADTGTFTGTVTVSLQADSSGAPSGSALATITLTNAEWAALFDDTTYEFIFSTEYGSITDEDTYWIVVEASTADNTNHPNIGGRTSGGNGDAYRNNTTDGWVQLADSDLYFEILEGIEDRVLKTDTNGKIPSEVIDRDETGLEYLNGVGKLDSDWYNFTAFWADPGDTTTSDLWNDAQNLVDNYRYFSATLNLDAGTGDSNVIFLNNMWPSTITEIIADWWMDVDEDDDSVTSDYGIAFGLTTSAGSSEWAENSPSNISGRDSAGFFLRADGVFETRTMNDGVETDTTLTGYDPLELHHYRIHATATSVKYYIDDKLVATHTTNLPTNVHDLRFAIGRSFNTANHDIAYVSAPNIAVKMR